MTDDDTGRMVGNLIPTKPTMVRQSSSSKKRNKGESGTAVQDLSSRHFDVDGAPLDTYRGGDYDVDETPEVIEEVMISGVY